MKAKVTIELTEEQDDQPFLSITSIENESDHSGEAACIGEAIATCIAAVEFRLDSSTTDLLMSICGSSKTTDEDSILLKLIAVAYKHCTFENDFSECVSLTINEDKLLEHASMEERKKYRIYSQLVNPPFATH